MIIHAKRIVSEDGVIDGYLKIEDGIIKDIINSESEKIDADIDYKDATIIPGIFDTHNHGYLGWDPSKGKEKVLGFCKAIASVGVTSIFPTVVNEENSFKGIAAAAKENSDGARIMGIHSEGPYLNRVGEKGVDTGHPDIDLNHIQEMIDESEGLLRLVALAPELEGSKEAIKMLRRNGIRVAFAHSNQTYEEAIESFKDGISVITHTANVMSGIHHRNMGGLGAALLNDDVYNELICDGLHVRNEMIDIIFRVKRNAFDKIMMISDNVHIGGLKPGRYDGVFGTCTITEEGFSLTDTGRLAGSAKPVLFGMKNLVNNLNIDLKDVCVMASLNPARVYNFSDHKGSISIGKDADIVVIDDEFNCLYTYREGKLVYDHEKDIDLHDPDSDSMRIGD